MRRVRGISERGGARSVKNADATLESALVAPGRPLSPPACRRAHPPSAIFCSAAPRPKPSARTTGSWTARSAPPESRCSPTTRISARRCRRPGTSRTCPRATSTSSARRCRAAPAVALGRNRFIAWGATNVAADVEDLYRERIDATGRFAEFRGVQEPLTIVDETIAVKGGQPVHVGVRISRHGPLVSDAINANNADLRREPKPPPLEPLAFRWTALDPNDTTLASFLKLNEARNWTEFTAALGDFVVPSQNFVYGDVEGHIGYYAPGPDSDSREGRRRAARRRLDRRRRVDRMDSVRRTAACGRPARALHRHREQPACPARLSVHARARLAGTVPCPAHHRPSSWRPAEVHAGRFRTHPGRHAVAARADAPAAARAARASRRCIRPPGARHRPAVERGRQGRQRGRGDFRGLVPPACADARRRPAGTDRHGELSGALQLRDALRHERPRITRQRMVRRCDDEEAGDV